MSSPSHSEAVSPSENERFAHPERFPKNAPGPFYTLGDLSPEGVWVGRCLSCNLPEEEAPTLLAPLTGENSDTYFVRQAETDEEIDQACTAIEVCCVDALRYGGTDPKILARLRRTNCCDHSPHPLAKPAPPVTPPPKKWWKLGK